MAEKRWMFRKDVLSLRINELSNKTFKDAENRLNYLEKFDKGILFLSFINKFDDWNAHIKINDNGLKTIVEDVILNIMYNDSYNYLHDMEVVSFGFYDGVLAVRVK